MVCRSCCKLPCALASLLTSNRCGQATYDTSGYVSLQKDASNYNIPIFFSETGCIVEPPRTFDDQAAIFGEKMVDTWSGAIIYEWIQETNDYGLVEIKKGKITKLSDFDALKKQFAEVENPSGDGDYIAERKHSKCPKVEKGVWEAEEKLPALPKGAQKFLAELEAKYPKE